MLSQMLGGGQGGPLDLSGHRHSPASHSAWGSNQTRAHQPHTGMASALASNPYSQPQQNSRPQTQAPRRLPSPPEMDDQREGKKFSLPGIQNLLTDFPREEAPSDRQQHDLSLRKASVESSFHGHDSSALNSSRVRLPPTPPLRPGSGFEPGNHSPRSYASSHQSSFSHATQNNHHHHHQHQFGPPASSFSSTSSISALNNLEPYAQRQLTFPPLSTTTKRPSVTSQGYSPYATSSAHTGSPNTTSTPASYQASPIEAPSPATSLLYGQRPLPTNFPPPPLPLMNPTTSTSTPSTYPPHPPHSTPTSTPSTWASTATHHHHHSFPPSSSLSPYGPQSPDRYICPQCNKAFSRPSSLKIHSHSHTGEKPFRCGHPGCGKAFSVRSNMKRHEKGCHGDGGGSAGAYAEGYAEGGSSATPAGYIGGGGGLR